VTAFGRRSARIVRAGRVSPGLNSSRVLAQWRATAKAGGSSGAAAAPGSKAAPAQPGTAGSPDSVARRSSWRSGRAAPVARSTGVTRHRPRASALASQTTFFSPSSSSSSPRTSFDGGRSDASRAATLKDSGSCTARDWISERCATAWTRFVTPPRTVTGLSIASFPSATASPPANATSWRQTPPPEATNATHRGSAPPAHVCRASREPCAAPGEGWTRAPSAPRGSWTSERISDVTSMRSSPTPRKRLRFDPSAAMASEREGGRRARRASAERRAPTGPGAVRREGARGRRARTSEHRPTRARRVPPRAGLDARRRTRSP